MVFDEERFSIMRKKINDSFNSFIDAEAFFAEFDEVDIGTMEDYIASLGEDFRSNYDEIFKIAKIKEEENEFLEESDKEEYINEEIIRLTVCGMIYEFSRDADYYEVVALAEQLKKILD